MSTVGVHPYTVMSSGLDWLTCTEQAELGHSNLSALALEELEKRKRAGGRITSAFRFGFQGHKTDGLFYGRRDGESCVVLSGPESPPLAKQLIPLATNVSRLDMQVTIWTHGEEPDLSLHGFRTLERSSPKNGRRSSVTLIHSLPAGDTLNVNKRVSDACGRLYDKAAESKMGTPKTIWRYECEFKRDLASHHAIAYATANHPEVYCNSVVYDWWENKGLTPTFEKSSTLLLDKLLIEPRKRDVLSWFESTVSPSIGRSIRDHGLERTLEALGLQHLVGPGQSNHKELTNDCEWPLSLNSDRDNPRQYCRECLALQRQGHEPTRRLHNVLCPVDERFQQRGPREVS